MLILVFFFLFLLTDIIHRFLQTFDLDTMLFCIIPKSRVNGFFCKKRTVYFHRRKSIQCLHNCLVCR